MLFTFLYAIGPIVQCSDPDKCNWAELVATAGRFINFLILISGSLAAISFAWAGWLYLTSGGDSGKATKAKGVFLKVLIGLILTLSAWLIVHEILKILGVNQGFSIIKTS